MKKKNPKNKITAAEVKSLPEGMHPDGNGLYLRVQESGTRSWIFRFQLNKRRREMGIGTPSTRSLAEARCEAALLSGLVRSGIDPIEKRKQETLDALAAAKAAEAQAVTFDTVAAEYIEGHKAAWKNTKHAQQWANTLATYASPIIGGKPVSEITTEDVLTILNPIWIQKTETATRVRSRIEIILSYAKGKGWRRGENPAMWRGHLDTLLPKPGKLKNQQHHPALPYTHIPAFMTELRKNPGIAARALEFAILTAARSGEVRLAKWDEINLEAKTWTIPAARMKAKREHWVPLSEQAIQLLTNLPKIEGNNYIFPGERDKKALSDMTLSAIVRRMNKTTEANPLPKWIDPSNNSPIVPHGFRSTFRDWAAEIGHYPRDLAEHALAHSLPNKVEAAYQRRTMLERRAPMMQSWANYIDQRKAEVINIHAAA